MTLYESLVIRQPLQRIIDEKNQVKEKKNVDNKIYLYRDLTGYGRNNDVFILANRRQYDRTHAYETIGSYLENLKNKIHVSKLSLAAVFTSDKMLKLVDKYQETVTRSQDNIRQLITFKDEIIRDVTVLLVSTYIYIVGPMAS